MENHFLVIGMSPGNGYFKEEVIREIIKYSLLNHKKIGIMIPDTPAISTYLALGYPENIARKKAILQGNAFRNRIARIIEKDKISLDRIILFDWEKEVTKNKVEYLECYNYLENLYKKNKEFEQDINKATNQVLLNNPFKKKELTLSDRKKGTHYIISEFAFMIMLPKIKSDYDYFVYGYHKPWPVFEKFISGDYDSKKENIGFMLFPDFSKKI